MTPEDDDIGADIRAALETANTAPAPSADKGGEPPPSDGAEPSPPPAQDASDGERARDEQGRFAKKEADAPKPKEAQPQPAPQQQAKPIEPPKPAAPTVAPPINWKGAGKVEWNRLPQHIQKEIADDYARFQKEQSELAQFKGAITPERAQTLTATYGSVDKGLQSLLALSDMADRNPAGFLQWFAQTRGINLSQFAGQAQQQGQQPAPDANPMMQEVNNLRNQLAQMQSQFAEQMQAPIVQEVNTFASSPDHPYFNDVYDHMMALIPRIDGSPRERLQKAYEQAVWAHPEIRTTLIEQERKKQEDAEAAKANAARQAAGSSITGSSSPVKVPDDDPDETLEDTIRRQARRVLAR